MAATTVLRADFQYSDGTTTSFSLGPYKPTDSAVAGVFKAKCIAFNDPENTDTGVVAVSDTFVSKAGAPCTGIKSARATTTDSTLIYSRLQA